MYLSLKWLKGPYTTVENYTSLWDFLFKKIWQTNVEARDTELSSR